MYSAIALMTAGVDMLPRWPTRQGTGTGYVDSDTRSVVRLDGIRALQPGRRKEFRSELSRARPQLAWRSPPNTHSGDNPEAD
jgi:hypothetical protein